MAKKNHHGPSNPGTGKTQAKQLEAEKRAKQRAADAAHLKTYAERCKRQQEAREKRAIRVAELQKLSAKKAAIRRKYQ